MIEVSNLTKRFGEVVAVDDLSFRVEPGVITGFLGPNGAGKTTTLRTLLGLVRPTGGSATIDGRSYRELDAPARYVGAVLEATSFHPGRRARNHLRILASAARIDERRVDEVLKLVGLDAHGGRRIRGYSLGMRQRLSLAGALLGDPQVLILDEPANGLDPEGIRWLREFLRSLASQGRTILVSSHALAEVEQTVDRVVIIHRGRLVRESSLPELAAAAGPQRTLVRSSDAERLRAALASAGFDAEVRADGRIATSAPPERAGAIASENGVPLTELTVEERSLEDVFFRLTSGEEAAP